MKTRLMPGLYVENQKPLNCEFTPQIEVYLVWDILGSFPKIRGPQYRPQYTTILIIASTIILGNPLLVENIREPRIPEPELNKGSGFRV